MVYSGAGLEQSPLTEEEREVYLKTVGQPELLHRPGEAGYGADERVSHRENRTDAGTDENRIGWTYLAPMTGIMRNTAIPT